MHLRYTNTIPVHPTYVPHYHSTMRFDRRLIVSRPIQNPPTSPEQLTADAIPSFMLSPLHSHGKNRKQRIRGAPLVFHPDRFDKWTRLVCNETDRQRVREAARIVVRVSNVLLEAEE